MIHAQTKGNGVDKHRTYGEEAAPVGVLMQPHFAGEIHRVMTAVQHGQVHERARLDGATLEENILTTPLAYVVEWLGSVGKGELPPLRVAVGPLRKTI